MIQDKQVMILQQLMDNTNMPNCLFFSFFFFCDTRAKIRLTEIDLVFHISATRVRAQAAGEAKPDLQRGKKKI